MPWYWWIIIVLSFAVAGLSIALYAWYKATNSLVGRAVGWWLKGNFGARR